MEEKYINVTLTYNKDKVDFITKCGLPFCIKDDNSKTSIVEKIIYETVVKKYFLELGDISTETDENNCYITYQIGLSDDADTIGDCIVNVKDEIEMSFIIFKNK